ncbi:glycosyltransferase family 4 protein [Priestia megaterium]|uniref:glycosyltransferase family 4 protein n=1 Tax=Priestia megaterium TaxID=1404 RepID=UPI0025B16C6A|nr:glycosyltransferase family 4 protein [Priestia megaterium]MDN3233467.1 glycosyltransferase family 4 protein [Priestia megaterium]
MYKAFLALCYLVTLYIGNTTIQRIIFNACIGVKNPLTGGRLLLRVSCRMGKQVKFIGHLKQSYKLEDNEKRYLMAYAFRNLGLYNRAWLELKSIQQSNPEIDSLKCNTLYNSRNIQELININEEIAVSSTLDGKQKDFILKYAFRNHSSTEAHRLCEIFGDDSNDYNSLVEKYTKFYNNSETWVIFLEKHSKNYELNDSSDIEKCISWLQSLPEEQGRLGINLLLKNTIQEPEIFSMVINEINRLAEQNQLNPDLIEDGIRYMAIVESDLRENNSDHALKLLIRVYKEGDRSRTLHANLIRTLKKNGLKRQYYNDLRSIIDDGFLDLSSKDALYLLVNCRGFHELYNGIYFIDAKDETFSKVILTGKNLPRKVYKEFLVNLIEPLIDPSISLPFNDISFKDLSSSLSGMHKWDILHVRWYVQQGDISKAEEYIVKFPKEKQLKILLYIAKYCHENKLNELALYFGEKAYEINPNNVNVLRRLIASHNLLGNITQRLKFITKLRKIAPERLFSQEYDMAFDEYSLQKQEWNWSRKRKQIPHNGPIIHVLNKSLPEVNGYTIRSSELVEHQKKSNLDPVVVTKLGWPFSEEVTKGIVKEVHNGIEHYRLYDDKGSAILNKVPMSDYFRLYADQFGRALRQIQPSLVHAASNFQNALPALKVAQKYNIPSVYEVRGLWHDTQCTKTDGFENSERYLLHQHYELICCHIADRVIAISKSLKEHLITLGIPEEKIYFVPNGVDVKKFSPQNPNLEIRKKLDLEDKLVIGFIGSVTHYEGLDYLLKALAELKKEELKFKFVLVGDGKALPDLKKLTRELDLEDFVTFVGRVPHNEVKDYYSVIDVFPFPRTSAKVCQLVTPLKPFEVMAMGKLVLVSDIPALREMVIEGETGLVFKSEDVSSLVKCIKEAENNKHLAKQGREWVVQNRAWDKLAERYNDIYKI